MGSGAFGFVSIGESLITDEEVAIKEIYPSQYAAIEIEIMSSLKFRYCVSCIDWKNNPDETYIVMEYCRGGDLFKAIDAEMLTEKRVKRVAKCVLLALEYLHSHYICHRDIKPENILCYETTYDNEEVWKVTDFGLSCYFQPGTPIFGAVGTPHYKAPEIYPPSEYTEAVDLWSLGVTIYVALTAQFVWDGNTDAEIEASMRQGRLEYDQSLSFTAFEWIEQLLQPNPANRMTIPQALTHHWFQ
uniref:Protein kinase domain-containing protein n=1 Tax=Arcella intermedia TaxID=1963864 RepID=A0A6B2LFL2_9EUKA